MPNCSLGEQTASQWGTVYTSLQSDGHSDSLSLLHLHPTSVELSNTVSFHPHPPTPGPTTPVILSFFVFPSKCFLSQNRGTSATFLLTTSFLSLSVLIADIQFLLLFLGGGGIAKKHNSVAQGCAMHYCWVIQKKQKTRNLQLNGNNVNFLSRSRAFVPPATCSATNPAE